jgi:hypothetical protein
VLSVLIGTGLAVLVSSFVLPWYTSAWALETMGGAYAAALQLPAIGYARLCGWGAGSGGRLGPRKPWRRGFEF